MKPETLHRRILLALSEFQYGKAGYHALMRKVWPSDKYPRAFRHSVNGGPPGVAMVYGKALSELQRRGLISRCPSYIGAKEERFGQSDVLLLSGGRREIKVAEECGKCGGTGEIACSSTSYMACPECSKGAAS
jgi:hypothetical protein